MAIIVATAVVVTGGAAAPAAGVLSSGSGVGATVIGASATATTTAAGATATATTAGAVTTLQVAGAAGASTSAAGTSAAVSVSVAVGPVGLLILGAENDPENKYEVTFDCWKSVVHDESKEPCKGRLLQDVLSDSRVEGYEIFNCPGTKYPEIKVKNVWKEEFRIEYVILPWGELAAHAARIQ